MSENISVRISDACSRTERKAFCWWLVSFTIRMIWDKVLWQGSARWVQAAPPVLPSRLECTTSSCKSPALTYMHSNLQLCWECPGSTFSCTSSEQKWNTLWTHLTTQLSHRHNSYITFLPQSNNCQQQQLEPQLCSWGRRLGMELQLGCGGAQGCTLSELSNKSVRPSSAGNSWWWFS